MDEYAALAQRVALTLDDVRGCLVLSRDGLVLGAHPEQEESAVKQAWLRFAHVGDPRRSFVEFGDQIWGFVHRGPYTAFIVAGATVRPGILLDQLEQVLLAAEEARTRRDAVKVPDAASAPSGRPRTALHPPLSQPAPAAAAAVPEVESLTVSGVAVPPVAPIPPAVGGAGVPSAAGPATGAPVPPAVEPFAHPTPHLEVPAVPATEVPAASAFLGAEAPAEVLARSSTSGSPNVTDDDVEAPKEREKDKDKEKKKDKDKDKERDKKGSSPFSREPQPLVSSGWMSSVGEQDDETSDDPAEIDRVMLAKEFSGLLQLDEAGDEGSS